MVPQQVSSGSRWPNRILYSSLVDVSLPNGPGVNERGFLRDMAQRFDGRLLALVPRPLSPDALELGSAEVIHVPAHGSLRRLPGWIQVRLRTLIMLPAAIRSFGPDLVVLRTGALPISHLWALRRCGVPYVIKTAGDVTHRGFYSAHPLRRSIKLANDKSFAALLRGAQVVDVVSDAQRTGILRRYPELSGRVFVIDNGVELDLFTSTPDAERRARFGFEDHHVVVGFVGSYPMERGGREVVDIVAELKDRHPVRGMIVGDSGQRDALEAYVRARGVEQFVVVFGQSEYAGVPGLMRVMDIGLSILRPKERERGFSEQKVRQYLASGLVVVGTEGSNDFLAEHPFARVVTGHASEIVIEAARGLMADGRSGLAVHRAAARQFAERHLAIRARNDQRLQLWADLR